MATRYTQAGPKDGVETWLADTHDINSYAQAQTQLARMHVPVLVSKDQPNTRLFVANFDGTDNDKNRPGEQLTNVAHFYKHLKATENLHGGAVEAEYVAGVGTQGGWRGTADQAIGYTSQARVEEMYVKFINQAHEWKKENPEAEISVVSVGFSRGAIEATLFTRLVDAQGIQNPEDMKVILDSQGHIDELKFTKQPIVPPKQTPQVVALFDPVNTGVQRLSNAQLPSSVVAGFQISAEDERRDLFQLIDVVRPGLSNDHRFLNVTVGGAHSDIGGGYARNGLSTRSANVMADFVNSLSDTPLVKKQAVPQAPEMHVVHRSEQHQYFYTTIDARIMGERKRVDPLFTNEFIPDVLGLDIKPEPTNTELARPFKHKAPSVYPDPISNKIIPIPEEPVNKIKERASPVDKVLELMEKVTGLPVQQTRNLLEKISSHTPEHLLKPDDEQGRLNMTAYAAKKLKNRDVPSEDIAHTNFERHEGRNFVHFFSKNRRDIVTIDVDKALDTPVDQTLQEMQAQAERENMRQMETQARRIV